MIQYFNSSSIKVKEIAISKVEELQEELDKRVEERSRHGKTFDEIDLYDMQEQCRVTGLGVYLTYNSYRMTNHLYSQNRTKIYSNLYFMIFR